MIIVRVELHSAITGDVSELARMVIDKVGGCQRFGDYRVRTVRGRSAIQLDLAMRARPMKTGREGRVHRHARLREHVWNLVAKALNAMEYGR